MKFPRPQHQEPSEFGGGSGAEVGSADQAPRTSAPTRAPRHNKHPTNKYTNEKNNNAKAHALHRHVFNGLACCLTERSGVSRSTRARRRRRSREVAWISYAYDPMFLSKTNVTKKKKRRERMVPKRERKGTVHGAGGAARSGLGGAGLLLVLLIILDFATVAFGQHACDLTNPIIDGDHNRSDGVVGVSPAALVPSPAAAAGGVDGDGGNQDGEDGNDVCAEGDLLLHDNVDLDNANDVNGDPTVDACDSEAVPICEARDDAGICEAEEDADEGGGIYSWRIPGARGGPS